MIVLLHISRVHVEEILILIQSNTRVFICPLSHLPRARPPRSSQRTLLVEQATDVVAYLKMRKRKPSALTWAPEDIVLALKVGGAHAYGVPELLLAEVQRKVTVGGNTGADLRMMLENEALLGDFLTLKVGVISEVNFQVLRVERVRRVAVFYSRTEHASL